VTPGQGMSPPRRWAVLVSGRGSNLRRLGRLQAQGRLDPARLVGVAADRPCPALEVGRRLGLPVAAWPWREGGRLWQEAFLRWAEERGVEGVILAGFLRRLGPPVLAAFPGRILNLHPSLLPLFPGLEAPRRALEAGVRVTGVTVHFVDEGLDTGPILEQVAVRVRPEDDLERLTARLHRAEHRLLPEAVRAVSEGRVWLEGNRVRWRPRSAGGGAAPARGDGGIG
jgi:phosphoribosylglycinamide formyltransferase-1